MLKTQTYCEMCHLLVNISNNNQPSLTVNLQYVPNNYAHECVGIEYEIMRVTNSIILMLKSHKTS